TFLLSGLGTVVAAKSWPAHAAAADDWVGKPKDDLPTPALLLDLDAFETNLKPIADHCRQSGCGFRPHAKTHKCVDVGKRQAAPERCPERRRATWPFKWPRAGICASAACRPTPVRRRTRSASSGGSKFRGRR